MNGAYAKEMKIRVVGGDKDCERILRNQWLTLETIHEEGG